jgi:hypothetical protein
MREHLTMPFDMNNDYSHAGPGAKRRRVREQLDDVPPKIVRPEYRRNRKPENAQEEQPIRRTARSLRHKIIQLTLEIGSFGEIVDRLESEQYGPASKVLVSNIRDHALTVLKVMMAEGLVTEKALLRYRADAKEAQRRRFKRRDDD